MVMCMAVMLGRRSCAVAGERRAVAKAPLVEQLEPGETGGRESARAAPDRDGRDEMLQLIDQPVRKGACGERGAADREVARRARLEVSHGLRIEGAL